MDNKKIYAVKVLIEDVDANTCSVELFNEFEDAEQFMTEEAEAYAEDFGIEDIEQFESYCSMHINDMYITISIEEKEVH